MDHRHNQDPICQYVTNVRIFMHLLANPDLPGFCHLAERYAVTTEEFFFDSCFKIIMNSLAKIIISQNYPRMLVDATVRVFRIQQQKPSQHFQ